MGGFLNNLNFKGFALDFHIQFVKQTYRGYKFGDRPGLFFSSSSSSLLLGNQPVSVLNRWQKTGDITAFQRFSSNYPSHVNSAYFAALSSDVFNNEDASYMRLKIASLSWQVPNGWLQKAHLENARIFVHGQNLWTLTNYSGFDPETRSTISLPPLRVWTFGAQVTF